MQELASRIWTKEARHHPGQLAWSVYYGEGLTPGPVELFEADGRVAAWAWAEDDGWLELCVDPAHPDLARDAVEWFVARAPEAPLTTMVLESETHVLAALLAAGFAVVDQPWFTHHFLDLAVLSDFPAVGGYTFRHVERHESEERAACHRAAWSSPGSTSRVTDAAYGRLMRAAPYRPELDWVAVDTEGAMVASACLWLDARTGVVLVEPVGCAPDHRRHGLAAAVSLAALHASRDLGARTGLVCPRGDDDYPAPQRLYRGLGFQPGRRTLTLTR